MSNISKKKLAGNNIGLFFGTFAPLHCGHVLEIYKAAMLNDGLVLIVSGYKNDRGDLIGLNLDRRFRYLREAFNDEPNIYVQMLNEDGMPTFPNGWDDWTKKLVEITKDSVIGKDYNVNVYVGEEDYKTELLKRIPKNWTVTYSNRNNINISATEIRKDPIKNFSYINRVFRRAFTKKVLLVGSASTGKSTLCKRLARSINAPFSTEYSRTYQEISNRTDAELSVNDYFRLIQGQYDANSAEIKSTGNQGIVFFDTDAIVTRVYAKLYLNDEDFIKLDPFFKETIKNEEIDLILVIPPITKYVDDGYRNMEWEESRYEFHNELMKQISEFKLDDKVVMLDTTDPENEANGFYLRYLKAVDAVNNVTGFELPKLD